jgi:hypothetical protein
MFIIQHIYTYHQESIQKQAKINRPLRRFIIILIHCDINDSKSNEVQ